MRRGDSAVAFVRAAGAYFAGLGVAIKRVLTGNGLALRSRRFAAACRTLGLQHSFTRPYRPRADGKAERLIQSALRESAL
jgi:transposase InsO family protein